MANMDALSRWEREFRAAAAADDYRIFGKEFARLELEDEPESMLEGTIHLVTALCAYSELDGRTGGPFLQMQQYDPAEAPGACYTLTFFLFNDKYGRLLTDGELSGIDLADLYDFPWPENQSYGFGLFSITRIDGANLTGEEIDKLNRDVEYDIWFDFGEEVAISRFGPESGAYVQIYVSDIPEEDRVYEHEDEAAAGDEGLSG